MDLAGVGPATFALRMQRSTTELQARISLLVVGTWYLVTFLF